MFWPEGKTHVIHVDSRFYLFFWKEWGLVIVMEETNLFKASNQLNNGFAKLFTVSKPSKHHTLWHLLVESLYSG